MNKLIITGLIIFFLLIIIVKQFNGYGLISNDLFNVKIINCELNDKQFKIINKFMFNHVNNQSVLVNGFTIFNLLFIQSVNDSFNPKINCFNKHSNDIIFNNPLNLSIKSGLPYLFNYSVSNNQDQRLFFECTVLTDCNLSRKFFTGYLNPGSNETVFFNITCSKGVHESVIKTVFVDELKNYHYINDSLIISAD